MAMDTMAALGITPALLAGRQLRPCEEAPELVCAEVAPGGREHLLVPEAAAAWREMRAAAQAARIDIHIISAYRSVARQAEIIRARLERGAPLEQILRVLAPPGYSEHHTGHAVDICTAGVRALQAEFEHTPAFAWLCDNARAFGFLLSYPRGNPAGYQYEPWHWCFRAPSAAGSRIA